MNRLNFNGRVNSVNGIRYRYSGKSNILSLYIDDIQHKKKKIRAEMSPDANHRCPHIHIKGHEASFSIKSGKLLAGQCDARTSKVVKDWILKHKKDLLQLWDIMKEGKPYYSVLEKIRDDRPAEDENTSLRFDQEFLDTLSSQANANPRLRQAYDLRTTPEDNSQRILNAMEPGTILPIHRHRGSTETVVVLRGKIRQNFYDEAGQLVESFVAGPCSDVMGFSVELGRWHNTECMESGTVILECKDGRYEALAEKDILKV